ncbi:MAG: aminotransferase class I/II-fold pyridoxal phosphate-dependent enzyme, partial [Acidobacteria bacterium]
MINARLSAFGATIFAEMTKLAIEHDAVNLSQGFPDEDGPKAATQAAIEAIRTGRNQYARSRGEPDLVRAIAAHVRRTRGLSVDPLTEVTVHSGATEAIASFLLGVLEPGDEVIVFEPFYDSYPAVVSLAGAVPRYCTLRFPEFAIDFERLERLVGPKTRALVLNTPHNPTGKVFTRDELDRLARLCRRHDLLVLSDEVYEQMTWDGREHVSIATLDGMFERTVTVSSAGKLFSLTGWKIGWAFGPSRLIEATQAAHQFLTFSSATPLQAGIAVALEECGEEYFAAQRAELQARRD